jgi:hypothetical protein
VYVTGVLTQGFALAQQALYELESHLQSILLWLFWRWGLQKKLFTQAGFKP